MVSLLSDICLEKTVFSFIRTIKSIETFVNFTIQSKKVFTLFSDRSEGRLSEKEHAQGKLLCPALCSASM